MNYTKLLKEDQQERFEEYAGIFEFEQNNEKQAAERYAYLQIISENKLKSSKQSGKLDK